LTEERKDLIFGIIPRRVAENIRNFIQGSRIVERNSFRSNGLKSVPRRVSAASGWGESNDQAPARRAGRAIAVKRPDRNSRRKLFFFFAKNLAGFPFFKGGTLRFKPWRAGKRLALA
jgi:hypothetical protein